MDFYIKYRKLFRKGLAVLYLGFFFFRGIIKHGSNFISFFTYWCWSLEFFYFILSLIFGIKDTFFTQDSNIVNKMKIKRKIELQVLGEIAFVSQIVTVFFYWTVIFPKASILNKNYNISLLIIDIQLHGGGLILILLDYMYENIRGFSLRNHKYVFGFGLLYTLFHSILVLYSGLPVYPGINLQNIESYLLMLLALSSLIITHKILYISTHWNHLKDEIKSRKDVINTIFLRSNSFNVSPVHFLLETLYLMDNDEKDNLLNKSNSNLFLKSDKIVNNKTIYTNLTDFNLKNRNKSNIPSLLRRSSSF